MRRFYLARTLRERVLLLAFALIVLGAWLPSALGRLAALRRDWASADINAEAQRMWLDRRAEIESRAASAGDALDPARTLDSARAFTELNRMAAGLTAEIAAQRSERSDTFAVHTIQVTLRRVDFAGILRFYEQLSARAPYLGIEHCTVSSERSAPGQLNAVFRVYSIEALPPRN